MSANKAQQQACKLIIVVLLNLWLILAESDILSDYADGLGSDVKERGNVLQVKMLNYARTTLQQLLIALAGRGAVEVEITRTELEENVLGNDGTQLHRLYALIEILLQLLPRNPQHAAGHHRLDSSLRRLTVEERRIVNHEFACEREPCDVLPIVTAMIHILEAPLCDEAEPSFGVAFALQLVALEEFHRLTLTLAKLAQRLNINTIFPEFLFHRQCLFGCKVTPIL